MDFLGRLIAGIVAAILIVLFPLQYLAQSNSETVDSLVEDRTREFTDSIRYKGYLDISMYEEYVEFLDRTGDLYDVLIEDIRPVTGEEISLSGVNGQGVQKLAYPSKERKDRGFTYEVDDASFNQLSGDRIQSMVAHTHTAECYIGHNHDVSEETPGYICHDGALVLVFAHGWTSDIGYRFNCATCGDTIISLTANYFDTNDNYFIMTKRWNSYLNEYALTRSNYFIDSDYGDEGYSRVKDIVQSYYSLPLNAQTIYKNYPEFNYTGRYSERNWITTTSPPSCLLPNDTNPICNQVVTSITATNPTQTVTQGGTIITTATATYLDGHTGVVNCTSNFNTNVVGTQTVTLTYSGKVGNAKTTGTRTCTITVTVNPNRTLSSLSVTPATQTINRYGTPSFTVKANYSDGTSKTLTSGQYTMTGFNSATLGEQTITFSFTEGNITKTATAKVFVRGLSSISITPATQTIGVNGSPTFTVKANYSDGTSITLSSGQYTVTGLNASTLGEQTITITYKEGTITKIATVKVFVDGLASISVTPLEQNVVKYTAANSIPLTVTLHYMSGKTATRTNGYTVQGYNPSQLGLQNITVSYTEGSITKTASAKVNVTVLKKICPSDGTIYDLNPDDSDPGCPICLEEIIEIRVSPDYVEVHQGDPLPITVKAIYVNGTEKAVYGWTSTYDPNSLGLQYITIEYEELTSMVSVWVREKEQICPICGNSYPISEPKCPVCASKVLSITVSPKELTVRQYETIILTVTAYYADGSHGIVEDWSIDHNTAEAGTFIATIKYGEASETITLTVIPLSSVVCPICGLIYNPSEHAKGCPLCSETIIGIEAYLTTGTNLVQLGTYPSIAVILIFRDEHRELATKDHTLDNYNPDVLGTQIVTVIYETFSTTIEVEVVNSLTLVTCPNGHMYYLNGEGTDPGCPFCHIVGEETVIYYFDITYTNEILEIVYKEGIYHFDEGNYISLNVTKKDLSLLSNMQRMFFKTSMLGSKKRFIYGGEIL